jgi:hypothetical protein
MLAAIAIVMVLILLRRKSDGEQPDAGQPGVAP